MRTTTALSVFVGLLLTAGAAAAQAPATAPLPITNPTPGCTATPAQIEQVRQVGIAITRSTGAARVAFADPSYQDHNPAFVKGAREAGRTDFDHFKARFGGPARAGGPPPAAGPTPPPGNPTEIVMVECDLVTIIHRNNRQDPTAPPGTFYEVFTFDTYRVRNGKFTEHWDSSVITPPASSGGRDNQDRE